MYFISIQVVHPYSSTNTVIAWKKSCFILSKRSDFYMIDNLSIAIHALTMHMLTEFSGWDIAAKVCGDGSLIILRIWIIKKMIFSPNADSKRLSFSLKLDWKLLYSLEHFKCIALINISQWCVIFVGWQLYINIQHNENDRHKVRVYFSVTKKKGHNFGFHQS